MAKTKTTTRSKPATSKKTETAGSAAPDGAADIRMIPLDQLEPSQLNVRKVAASASDDAELLASIRETGIKQNLVVHALSETRFAVDAGGRRLKSLKQLAEDGVIPPADHPVPCLVEDERNAILTSATENLQRAAMHPADQFEAFDKMIGEGRSEDEIALKFGVSVDLVRRRLKLARVAPEIIERFRAGGDLTLECVMAFTLTDDHDRQLAVWNAVKGGYHIHPQSIKRQLTETAHSANSALGGRFVGIEAYEAAGGVLLRDLFDDRASAHMENPELLERLAIEKLQAAAKPFEGTWKWVEVHLSVDYGGAFRSFGRVYPQDIEPDPDLLAEEEHLIAREEELAAQNDGEDWTDAETEEYYAIEPRLREIEALQRERQPFADADRAIAGVVLTIGHDGALRVEKGLVRPEDIPAAAMPDEDSADAGDASSPPARPHVTPPTSSTPVPTSDPPAATLRKADGISASLADDLRATRQHILRRIWRLISRWPSMRCSTRSANRLWGGGPTATRHSTSRSGPSRRKTAKCCTRTPSPKKNARGAGTRPRHGLDEASETRGLPDDVGVAHCGQAGAFRLGDGSRGQTPPAFLRQSSFPPDHRGDRARLDVDVAACWRPTAQNYWGVGSTRGGMRWPRRAS